MSEARLPARRARPALRIGAGTGGPLLALVVLLLVNAAITPHFLAWQTLDVNATQVATIVMVATGMTLVIATGGIDLSVGSLMAIAGTLAPMIFLGRFGGLPAAAADALAIVVPVLVAGAFGWLNGIFVTLFRIQPIIATLIIMTGGIDLSVGAVAALGSVVSALASGGGWVPGLLAGAASGLAVGLLNGVIIVRLRIAPFITTLATML